ncbi:MAG: MFS transporter [Candidatus Izemoplasmatales bacterium]|jgi:DHA1 family multidrug resistance protein-like MFS transporter|nr:MFS transporter [Candidatus Izemoplasmatales bacterium]
MKKAVVSLIILYFIQGILHNLGHPVTPAFVRSLDIPDYMFGFFYSTMSFGLMVGAPIWGILADKGKKRFVMVLGLLLYSIGQIGFGYVGDMYWMVFFRFVSGFGVSASMTLFISHMIEVSESSRRAKHLAWMAAALALGASIGYALGGFINTNVFLDSVLNTSDPKVIFLIQASLNLIHALMVYIFINENDVLNKAHKKPTMMESFKNIKKINFNLLLFLVSLTFISISITNLSKYLDVYFNDLGYDSQDIGNFVFVTGIVSIATSVLVVPLIVKLHKNLLIMILTQIISVFAVIYVFRSNQFIIAAYTIYMVYIIGKSIYQPLEQNFIADNANEGFYSSIMGIRQSFYSIGMIVGPLIGGFLYGIKPLLVFDFSVLMIVVGLILMVIVYLRIKKKRDLLNS